MNPSTITTEDIICKENGAEFYTVLNKRMNSTLWGSDSGM
jgi:hypothetical protein